jgi:hypothetical protein
LYSFVATRSRTVSFETGLILVSVVHHSKARITVAVGKTIVRFFQARNFKNQ